jgi:hypothetical protein
MACLACLVWRACRYQAWREALQAYPYLECLVARVYPYLEWREASRERAS